MYSADPCQDVPDKELCRKFVIGGEACMWGEHIDASNIMDRVWPRAGAVAEKLWSPIKQLPKDPEKVKNRLLRFRCLLTNRGVASHTLQRSPLNPSSCLVR